MEKEQGFCEGKRLQDSKTRGRKIRKKDTTSFACSLFARPFPPRLLHWCTRRPRPFSRVLGRRWEARVEPRLPSRPFLLLFSASSCRRPRVFLSSSPPRGGGKAVEGRSAFRTRCRAPVRALPVSYPLSAAWPSPILCCQPAHGEEFLPLSDRGHWARSLDEVKRAKKGKRFFLPFFSFSFFFKRSKRKGKNGRGGRPRLRRVRCRGAT